MLLGLMSRWTIPRSWAAIRPRATPTMIASASGSSSRVRSLSEAVEALAGHEFQDEVRDAVFLVVFQYVDHLGVIGLGHEPGLLAEPAEADRIAGPVGPQDLDGDDGSLGRVLGAIHDPLPSLAQLVQQSIAAQAGPARIEDERRLVDSDGRERARREEPVRSIVGPVSAQSPVASGRNDVLGALSRSQTSLAVGRSAGSSASSSRIRLPRSGPESSPAMHNSRSV